jgi:transposase
MGKVMFDYKKEYSTKSIAELNGVSKSTATRLLDKISYPMPKIPAVVSIDEFKGNTGRRKFQCILADPKRREVLDILPAKNSEELDAYFLKFPVPVRNHVQCLGMALGALF